MSKAKQTAGKTAQGAATRKGDAMDKLAKMHGLPRAAVRAAIMAGANEMPLVIPAQTEGKGDATGKVMRPRKLTRKRKEAARELVKALELMAAARKAARKCGGGRLAHAWERTSNTRKSVFWMNADTLESLDKIAKNNGAKSRADALKTIIKKLTGATVKVSFDSDSNRIGAEAETPHPDCALFGTISGEAGIIFGEGWRRFRAMGLKLKMDADALVQYLVEEGYSRWIPADPTK